MWCGRGGIVGHDASSNIGENSSIHPDSKFDTMAGCYNARGQHGGRICFLCALGRGWREGRGGEDGVDKKRRNPLQICLMGAARLMDFSRLFGLW